MKAGKLDQRVTIERFSLVQNPQTGAMTETWAPLATLWAAVEPLQGREYFAAAAVQSEVTTRVRLRYRPGVTPADRVKHEGRIYNIESVVDVRSARRELVLMVRG